MSGINQNFQVPFCDIVVLNFTSYLFPTDSCLWTGYQFVSSPR